VWGRAQAQAAERAFTAAGPAVAAEIWPRVAADLEHYADQWQAMHRASCEASQRGEHSQEMLDRRMACLAERRTAMAEATRVLMEADLAVARRALAVVGELPAISRCGDLAALSAVVPVSADPQVRAAVEVQRSRLARVRSLEQGGRRAGATELAQDVLQAAERLGDRSLLAEALLQRAYLDIHGAASTPEQDTRLTRAYLTALGGGLDELVAEALALRLYARGRTAGGAGRALEDLAVAREAVTRLASPGRLRGLVLNNGGAVYLGIGEAGQAEPMFREALAAREAALGPEHVEVAFTLVNLAMVSGVEAERIGLMQRALGIFDEALGPAHPQTIDVRVAASLHARDPVAARGLLAPACDALARYAPDDRPDRARCLGYLAHHAAEAGDEAASTAMLLEVAELLQAPRPRTVDDADVMLLRGRAALASRGHVRAIEELRETLANPRNDRDWWQQRHAAELRLLLGLHLIQLGYSSEANTALREAVEGYEKASATTRDVFLQQRLAFARLVLGRALLAGPEGAREGSALLDAAERWYAEAGPGYAWRLLEIQRVRGPAVAP
jgi:eukaryotic-like serine/threonine-protein kinase